MSLEPHTFHYWKGDPSKLKGLKLISCFQSEWSEDINVLVTSLHLLCHMDEVTWVSLLSRGEGQEVSIHHVLTLTPKSLV